MCLVSFSKNDTYSSKKKIVDFKKDKPRWAYIEITESCSHQCRWCYGSYHLDKSNYISVESLDSLLAVLDKIGIEQVTLTGGEPTEHPDFEAILKILDKYKFINHLTTHGEHLIDLTGILQDSSIHQIQINFQGSDLHDAQHGLNDIFEKTLQGMKKLINESTIEVVTTTTVGNWNIEKIDSILTELNDIGVERVRFWEATGRGTAYLKNLEAKSIFEKCQILAEKYGYNYIQSYEPEFDGDIGVKCPPVENLHLSIHYNGDLRFCPTMPQSFVIGNFLTEDSDLVLERYLKHNKVLLESNHNIPWCPARENNYPDEKIKDLFSPTIPGSTNMHRE